MVSITYQADLVQSLSKMRCYNLADQLFKKEKALRQRRLKRKQKERSETWLFVCEGIKTEPNYITSLINYANSITDESPLMVKIEGVGKNTETLIKSVEDFFECAERFNSQKVGIPYAKTFVLFDKDSFTKNQFNNAILMAEHHGYIPIWSNECFELWYILHFEYCISNNGREAYFSRLSNLLNIKYDKADDVFSLIHSPEKLKNAMCFSKKLNDASYSKKTASERVPCTQMFRVIDEINNRLNIDLTKEK